MREEHRKSSHRIYDINIHIVWITKYRKKVLSGDITLRLRELIRRICQENKTEVGNVQKIVSEVGMG